MVTGSAAFAVLLCGLSWSVTVAQQAGCNLMLTDSQVEALIAANYLGSGQSSAALTIRLQLSPEGFTFRIACASSSGLRDQYRFVSVVAYFTTSDPIVSPPGVPLYGQFEFECVSSAWSALSPILDNTLFDRTILPPASTAIKAANRTDCAYCLNPILRPPRDTDSVNHCNSCNECSQPLCYITDTSSSPNPGPFFTSVCCNYFLPSGTCTVACPPSSFPDANRTCVPCVLSCKNGGTLRHDACRCNCSSSVVYGGTSCADCQCQNGGTCNGSTCTCPPGFKGKLCESPCPTRCPSGYFVNNCDCVQCNLVCQNGGMIRDGTCTCDCPPSGVYEGPTCTSCKCQNGGTCSGSACVCPPGYTGTLCETPCPTSCPTGYTLNNCNCVQCNLVCQNGGVIRDGTCTCNCPPSGVYEGPTCTSCRCQNGGTCSGSACVCPPGYKGTLCEIPCPTSCPTGYTLNNCNCVQCNLVCQNGGVIRDGTCTCNCPPSGVYEGPTCTSCRCQNGGTCSGSACVCPPGYTGTLCETPCPASCPTGYTLNNCNCVPCLQTCQNGGTFRSGTCQCDCSTTVVYGGTSCSNCLCQNGGTCSGAVCLCPPGYTGTLCGTLVPTTPTCPSCTSDQYLSDCRCVSCSTSIPNCLRCSNSTNCTLCAVGYAVAYWGGCVTMIEVNDTVIADPLINVHLILPSDSSMSKTSLCYEFHGIPNKYFNLLSNNCTSINAHYATISGHASINIIDEVAIHTADLANQCIDISVTVGCTALVNGAPVDPNHTYSRSGVLVTKYNDATVQVSVPTCSGGQSLAVWMSCQSGTLFDPIANERFVAPTMKVAVGRSLFSSGGGDSHGLLGQFWNIRATLQTYTGVYNGPSGDYYVLSLDAGKGKTQRSFVGDLHPFTWELKRNPCLYAGNSNGGSIVEVETPNDPIIEGQQEDYIVQSKFSTVWKYSAFKGRCLGSV